jgi:hypothetical protein
MPRVPEAPQVRVTAANPVYAVLATDGRQLDLDATVRRFFEECAENERRPIVTTAPGATLSPFVVSWLRHLSGFWATAEGGSLREVQTGAVVTDPIELFENDRIPATPPEESFSHTQLTFEIVLEHRADPGTTLGDAVPILLAGLDAPGPAAWDVEEPLRRRWDPQALTAHARTQMPLTPPMYWRAADSYGEIVAARTEGGVLERVRGGVAHPGTPRSALPRARRAAAALAAARIPVLSCAISAAGAEPDLRGRPAPDPPERPLVALLGPTALGRLGTSAAEVVARHGGETVGRARIPGALVTFETDDVEDARRRYLELVTP